MKYALFLYDDESFQTKPEAEQMAIVGEYMAFSEMLEKAGAYVSGEALNGSATARTLRPGGRVEDGPYSDTHEQLGGLYIVEAPDIETAIGYARQCPTYVHGGQIEVRGVPDYSGG